MIPRFVHVYNPFPRGNRDLNELQAQESFVYYLEVLKLSRFRTQDNIETLLRYLFNTATKVVIFFEMRNLFLAFLETGAGEPKRKRSFLPWPKRTGVKRRDRRERPERLLSERSEFQTRQRAKGTK